MKAAIGHQCFCYSSGSLSRALSVSLSLFAACVLFFSFFGTAVGAKCPTQNLLMIWIERMEAVRDDCLSGPFPVCLFVVCLPACLPACPSVPLSLSLSLSLALVPVRAQPLHVQEKGIILRAMRPSLNASGTGSVRREEQRPSSSHMQLGAVASVSARPASQTRQRSDEACQREHEQSSPRKLRAWGPGFAEKGPSGPGFAALLDYCAASFDEQNAGVVLSVQ